MTGSVTLDFKDSACQRALAQALLKSDFGLDVDFPVDRLIPAVPQRLNYIHWLEDIFTGNSRDLTGIDVGEFREVVVFVYCAYPHITLHDENRIYTQCNLITQFRMVEF